MEPFHLGQPLSIWGRDINYIGGLENVRAPGPECADFTSDEDEDGNGNSDKDDEG
jgi:hypothetical protein